MTMTRSHLSQYTRYNNYSRTKSFDGIIAKITGVIFSPHCGVSPARWVTIRRGYGTLLTGFAQISPASLEKNHPNPPWLCHWLLPHHRPTGNWRHVRINSLLRRITRIQSLGSRHTDGLCHTATSQPIASQSSRQLT